MKDQKEISTLETHLGYWMRFVSNHVSHTFSQKLESHEVTVAEWVVLRELFRIGETAPSHLAESLGMTRGAISKLIERLVGKELIKRSVGEGDKRYQSIVLTAEGIALVPQLAELADQNDAEFFGHLDQDQQTNLKKLLQEIVQRHGLKNLPTE